jgi:hypothetical protein
MISGLGQWHTLGYIDGADLPLGLHQSMLGESSVRPRHLTKRELGKKNYRLLYVGG